MSERKEKGGGGVGIMVSKGLKMIERKDLVEDKVEAVWCNVYAKELSFIIGSVYIPPDNKDAMTKFFRSLERIKLKTDMPIIVTGDFNASHSLWHNRSNNILGQLLHDFLLTKDLTILNDCSATRKDRIIDLTITDSSFARKVNNWKVDEEIFLKSDHKLITFELGTVKNTETWERWNFKAVDWKKWETECDVAFEECFKEIVSESDVNKIYSEICKVILDKAEEIIPKKKICLHSRGWWSSELSQCAKNAKKAKRRFNKRSDMKNYEEYLQSMKIFKEAGKEAKSNYLDDLMKMIDPKNPQKFWNIINKGRKDATRSVVQPIKRQDGSYAVEDLEIVAEMKKHYGKESLDVKDKKPEWYNMVERQVKENIDQIKIDLNNNKNSDDFENSDLTIDEVEMAVESTSNTSAPSPEEKIFTILIKNGGERLLQCLHFLFQKCWAAGKLCSAFKLDPKVLLPKPDKENYNTVKSYRPITLESTIGKIFQRTIAYRLRWKLEVSNGIAKTQDAYKKQHSCVQSVVRVINQLHEAKARKDYSVVLIMDFESCFEKVWRSGLLWKALKKGINGRMLMFLHNYVTDRKYSLRVNEEKSDWVVSSVGIPQGSVLSPLLCTYTHLTLWTVFHQITVNMLMTTQCGRVETTWMCLCKKYLRMGKR